MLIIWIIVIICNYFICHVFKPELSKVAARRAAYTLMRMFFVIIDNFLIII